MASPLGLLHVLIWSQQALVVRCENIHPCQNMQERLLVPKNMKETATRSVINGHNNNERAIFFSHSSFSFFINQVFFFRNEH